MAARHDRNDEGRSDDMEVKLPFGSIRASGRIVVMVVLVLGLLGFIFWHDVKSTQQNTAVVEALQAVSYVLTLTDSERKELRLQMPPSLREKLMRQPPLVP